MNSLIASIHIPKCAGTTLMNVYKSVYGDRFFHLSGAVVDQAAFGDYSEKVGAASCISGHFSYRKFPGRSVRYVTFLRDPLERMLSYYWFIQGDAKNSQHDWTMRLTFREWLESKRLACLDNDMVRFLSGREHFNFNYPGAFIDRSDLEKAKAILKTFAFVGFVESFDTDISLMRRRLDWPKGNLVYKSERVSKDRPALAEISKYTLDVLKDTQKYDLELYEWARCELITNG